MTDDILRNNFWKAGSSGKKSDLAQRSGVIGTFGIGAMANFGVCSALRVETRHVDSGVTLVSSARRQDLRIAQDCIDLERVTDGRGPGTTVIAELDDSFTITEAAVRDYLAPYVRFLLVPVLVNGTLISQQSFESTLADRASGFIRISLKAVSQGQFSGTVETLLNPQGRALARLTDISLNGNPLAGEAFLVQDGGQTLGFRNHFGLAPIPVSSHYNFGGVINLNILHPTAGREALSRESIQHVAELVVMVEAQVSRDIAETSAADLNQSFQQYILSNGLVSLAKNVTVPVLPSGDAVALGQLAAFEPPKNKLFYSGRDQTILQRFASEQANLIHVSQANPRRAIQQWFLLNELRIQEVPENIIVDRIPGTQLSFEEAMFLVRLRAASCSTTTLCRTLMRRSPTSVTESRSMSNANKARWKSRLRATCRPRRW